MNKKVVKFVPVFLPTVSLALWTTAFILDQYSHIPDLILWLPLSLSELILSILCGILIKKLIYEVNNDPLTGLYNRRYFNRKLVEEMSRVKRTQSTLSLILIDADNFKRINDAYGHLKGDEILTKLADILKRNTRNIDIAARWGGEEFAVILPQTDLDGAKAFAERLRKIVEDCDFACEVTISIGIVSTCGGCSLDEILQQADEALYTAKERKNIVVVYPPLDILKNKNLTSNKII